MPNTGCLEGFCCPECGSEGPFDIEITTTARVYDSGACDTTDHEWDDDSPCECVECGHAARVEDFTKEANSNG